MRHTVSTVVALPVTVRTAAAWRGRVALRAGLVAVVALLLTAVTGALSPASATVLPGFHQLQNRQSAECLDVEFASVVPGDEVKIWRCVNAANQRWRPIPAPGSPSIVQLQVEHTGMCLTYAGLGAQMEPYAWADVRQAPCGTAPPLAGARTDQIWVVQPFRDGYSRIRTFATYRNGESFCLDKDFGDVTIWHCHDAYWQQWQSLG